jgi:FkbM family methyltransferase
MVRRKQTIKGEFFELPCVEKAVGSERASGHHPTDPDPGPWTTPMAINERVSIMPISRKGFLRDVGLAAAGISLGAVGGNLLGRTSAADAYGELSFSQCGEDMTVNFALRMLEVREITYLDVGAFLPTAINNTYLFYRKGHRGVLVEPNPALCEQLRRVRPKDTTLAVGIGFTGERSADYYVMNLAELNTFSKEEAEHQEKETKGQIRVREVVTMPLLNINDVMGEHFKGAPTFLSIDTEGLDLSILKTIDYKRFRPKIICAETLVSSTTRTIPEIPAFMATVGYVPRGGSMVNTLFVDSRLL